MGSRLDKPRDIMFQRTNEAQIGVTDILHFIGVLRRCVLASEPKLGDE